MHSMADIVHEIKAEIKEDPVYYGQKYFHGFLACVKLAACYKNGHLDPANYSRWKALRKLTFGFYKMARNIMRDKHLPVE